MYGFIGHEFAARLFEDCRTPINNFGSKDGLEDSFIRIACRTEEDNGPLVDTLIPLAKFTELGTINAVFRYLTACGISANVFQIANIP